MRKACADALVEMSNAVGAEVRCWRARMRSAEGGVNFALSIPASVILMLIIVL